MDEFLDQLVLALPCSYCKVEPGHWCRTKSGRMSPYLHSYRSWMIREAFGHGYHQGWNEGAEVGERRARASA